MLVRPPFPTIITNSMRSNFVSCPRKFELNNLHHWQPKHANIHLHAGGAFAKGMEVTRKSFFTEGLPAEDSIFNGWLALLDAWGTYEPDENATKTLERTLSAFLYYFECWPLETDFVRPLDDHTIEFSFAHPLPIDHPETGDPLVLCGRFDLLGQHKNGTLYVVDEKTTAQLGPTWPSSWNLSAQFSEYCWAARKYDYPVAGAIIRGVSILKTGHGHAQSIQSRPLFQLEQWYTQLLRDVQRMIDLWKEGYFDMSLGAACTSFGGCMYKGVCAAANPTQWLEADFIQREYNPYISRVEA